MIDEKKLIEDFMNNYLVYNNGTWNDAIDRAVELAKTAPKVGEWIPCSERQPREPVFGEDSYLIQARTVRTPYCGYWDGVSWTDRDSEPIDVIAWMPLPEPYREG